jgi:hypothetical protein
MALTCGYGEPAGRVAQFAAVERGPAQLDAVGIVAVLRVCSTLIGESSLSAGVRGLFRDSSGEAARSAQLGSHVRQVHTRARYRPVGYRDHGVHRVPGRSRQDVCDAKAFNSALTSVLIAAWRTFMGSPRSRARQGPGAGRCGAGCVAGEGTDVDQRRGGAAFPQG